jgi:hypothetical protein
VVKALCCKLECCRFNAQCGEIPSIYLILLSALGLGDYSASNINEYQKDKNNVSEE